MDEIGTDIPTFIAALHENYALSCSRSDGMESVNGCIDALSDSDLLSLDWSGGPGRRGGSARDIKPGSSANSLRQSEISFQVAVRGLLFSLPYPVKRQAGPPTKASNRGTSDTFKMFYPTSLRLWKETEEIESLVDKWTNPFASHGTLPSAAAGHVPEGVDSWSRRPPAFTSTAPSARQPDVDSSTRPIVSGNSARTETILERLPYVATIERRRGGPDPARLRELQRMTQFHGVDAPNDRIPNDDDDDTGAPEPGFHPTAAGGPGVGFAVPTGRPVEKLVLSDDDIEDDG
jgi:cell cycle checkpoint protein